MSAPSSTAWPDDGPAQPEVPDRGRPQGPVTGASPAVRRRVLVSIIAVGVVVLVGFWWHQTSASEVGDSAGELTAGGRLAGLVGGYLLLVQVLLMSRVPIIDRASSGARQSRWHRDLGAYVVIVIATHVVLITLGYAASSKVGVWHEAWTL